jgi:hypothetical protein
MPGERDLDYKLAINIIQNTLIPLIDYGKSNENVVISYYSNLYVIAMAGELAQLALRTTGDQQHKSTLKKLVENRNKLFHNKHLSSWLSPDITAMTPTKEQLAYIIGTFTSATTASKDPTQNETDVLFPDAHSKDSSKDKDGTIIKIAGTPHQNLPDKRKSEPVASPEKCMQCFWNIVTTYDALLKMRKISPQNKQIEAACKGCCLYLANFFVYGLGENTIVKDNINPYNQILAQDIKHIMSAGGKKHHGNLAHPFTSLPHFVQKSEQMVEAAAKQLCLLYQSQQEIYQSQQEIDSLLSSAYHSLSLLTDIDKRENLLKEQINSFRSSQKESYQVATGILQKELLAIQQAREDVQKLFANQSISPKDLLFSLKQLLRFEIDGDTPSSHMAILVRQKLMELDPSQQEYQVESPTAPFPSGSTPASVSHDSNAAFAPSFGNSFLQPQSHHVDPTASGEEDEDLKAAKKQSLSEAISQRKIGTREIPGWVLQDVEDKGNCFYDAVALQLISTNHEFCKTIAEKTSLGKNLRQQIQGESFKDKEWAGEEEMIILMRKLNCVVAIADTRYPNNGFTYHYINTLGDADRTIDPTQLPQPSPIVKLAFTGNHYMSVTSHPPIVGLFANAAPSSNPLTTGKLPLGASITQIEQTNPESKPEAKSTALAVELNKALYSNNWKSLNEWVIKICSPTNQELEHKRDLADVLNGYQQKQGDLNRVLTTFSLNGHHLLTTMLGTEPFAKTPEYKALHQTARNAQLDALAGFLYHNFMNDNKKLLEFIKGACDSPEEQNFLKKDLLDSLQHLKHPDLMKILEFISQFPEATKSLLSVIGHPEFSSPQYNNLKDMLKNKLDPNKTNTKIQMQKEDQPQYSIQQLAKQAEQQKQQTAKQQQPNGEASKRKRSPSPPG